METTSTAVKLYQHKRYIREPRQLGEGPLQQSVQTGLLTSTSSFDYWWPYPAWTATATAAAATTSPVFSSPSFAVPMTTQGAGIGLPLSTSSDSSTFPSSTSDAFTSTSSTPSTFAASSTSSPSPTSTSAPQSHRFNFHNFITNPHNLIPLLASVLGAILLSILLWFLCNRCCRHRYRSQNRDRDRYSSRYPLEGQGWRAIHAEKRSLWERLFGARDEPEEVIPGPRYVGIEDPDAEKDEVMDVERPGLGLDEERDIISGIEDDPFAPPKPRRAKTKSSDVRPKSSRSPSRTSSSASKSLLPSTYLHQDSFEFAVEDDQSDEEEEDFDDEEPDKSQLRVPWESLRHKSIKRAILAKVDEEKRWTDSMRGLRAAKAVRAALSLTARSGGASVEKRGTVTHHNGRSRSTRTECQRSERQQREQGEVGRGFRIVMESPPPQLPTPGSAGSGSGKVPWSLASAFPFQLFSNESQQEEKTGREGDPYTPVPTRMRSGSRSCGSSRAGSPVASPTKKSGGSRRQPTRPPMCTLSSPSVLRMRSPPSVMTPQMESALCFTPVLGSSARTGGGPGLQGINSPRSGAYRGRLVKARSAKGTEKEPEPGTIYTKTYRDRTDRAMRRVEAIVESGWNERGRVRH